MRKIRRFCPAVDCLQARIVLSTVAPVSTAVVTSTVIASAADDIGGPGKDPTGDGSYPVILAPPPGTPLPGGQAVC